MMTCKKIFGKLREIVKVKKQKNIGFSISCSKRKTSNYIEKNVYINYLFSATCDMKYLHAIATRTCFM